MDAVRSPGHSEVDDELRPGRLTERIEVPLGPLPDRAATPVEEHAATEAERIAVAALALPRAHGAMAIASMTDRLPTRVEGLAAGVEYLPVGLRGTRGSRAPARGKTVKAEGPAADPLGTWASLRDLAHVACAMARVPREHRATGRPAAFVGRPDMPPIPPDDP